MRQIIFIIVSLIVSAFFFYLALRDVPLTEVGATITRVDIGWVIISVLGVAGAIATRAVRWRGLMDGKPRFWPTFHIFNIGTLINQLPLRVGEVARAILITREQVPFVTAATSVLVERLIDLLVVFLLVAVPLSQLPTTVPAASNALILLGGGSVIGFIVLILLARFPAFTHRVLSWVETRLPILERLNLRTRFEEMLVGLRPLTHLRSAAHAILWTIIGWTFSLITYWALERAFDIQGIDLWLGSALTIGLVAFGIAIPVTVAGVGPIQAAARLAGDLLGLSVVTSSAIGLVFHGVTVISYAAWGVVGLIALGVSLQDIMKQAQRTKTTQLSMEADHASP